MTQSESNHNVSRLRPLTDYTIRVVSRNGVNDLDPEGERCEVSETTGDICMLSYSCQHSFFNQGCRQLFRTGQG